MSKNKKTGIGYDSSSFRILFGAYFFAALIFAQRAFAAALILALAAALILNFFLAGLTAETTLNDDAWMTGFPALILAHLAFWTAAILALPAALIPPFFFGPLTPLGAITVLLVEPSN